MRKILILSMLFIGFQTLVNAQDELKSKQISKEIQLLELENNRLILNKYIEEHSDSTIIIPVENIGQSIITTFQNSHSDLKELKKEYDQYNKRLDVIKYKDAEYRKYRKNYVASTGAEKEKQNAIYREIRKRLKNQNSEFKELDELCTKTLSSLNLLTLRKMLEEYQQQGEIFPTKFIPYSDLNRYQNLLQVKENQQRINILNSLLKLSLEQEIRDKFNMNDTIK